MPYNEIQEKETYVSDKAFDNVEQATIAAQSNDTTVSKPFQSNYSEYAAQQVPDIKTTATKTEISDAIIQKNGFVKVTPAEQITNFFQNGATVNKNNTFAESPTVLGSQKQVYKSTKKTATPIYVNTSSIDTSKFDGYRQGVEMTKFSHFVDGMMVKIHAGEVGHIIRKCNFGSDYDMSNYVDYYVDNKSKFNPITYINSQQEIILEVRERNYQVIDNDITYNYAFDGAIEPLTIRAKSTFSSIDFPFESHDVRGDVMSGNPNYKRASDQVCTVYEFESIPDFVPFLDLIEVTKTGLPIAGYFINETTKLKPYDDIVISKTITGLTGSYEIDMKTALNSMSGSTENYLSNKQRSATTGWDYDNNVMVGTDSIAFGGMIYLWQAQNHQEFHQQIILRIMF